MFEVVINEEKKKQLSVSKSTCNLNQRQSIIIPNLIRKRLNIHSGDEVTVSLSEKTNGLVIRKSFGDTLENKMIIGQRGSIRIPSELMRVLRLEVGDIFDIHSPDNDSFIFLEKIN
ncbi:AbrB/MazE/SpoVT family DNA-binding domain-containing protein [Halalkalibacter lacteus]|uniref:AbrB/MazE/SpoVT family DNA-binding domain-containing protein n=1 Tax=Halalkalibacter lacteus TaxID=3090663 RepID=UPI002FC88B2D